MITVSISINGEPIYTRSALNTGLEDDGVLTRYVTDAGDIILHKRDDGAVKLSIKILKTIKGLKRISTCNQK